VIDDSDHDPVDMDSHASRPEVVAALSTGTGYSFRRSNTLHIDMMYVTVRYTINGQAFVVRISDHLSEIQAKRSDIRTTFTIAAFIALLVTAVVSLKLAGSIIRPIVRLTGTSRKIARGDLAVEIGYQRLAEIQEEILWLCESARVPVIWATQVLENFVKKGIHSRAEMTDAAMSERAECVMLNKGDYLVEGVKILDDVLTRMQTHQLKKTPQLRALGSWQFLT
jgi:pyruvate kinase